MVLLRSTITKSASAPTVITPFFGYKPNFRAGFSQQTSTNRSREILPLLTPSLRMMSGRPSVRPALLHCCQGHGSKDVVAADRIDDPRSDRLPDLGKCLLRPMRYIRSPDILVDS